MRILLTTYIFVFFILFYDFHFPNTTTTIIITPWEVFKSADGFSLESEWQKISLNLQDSSQYSGRSQ